MIEKHLFFRFLRSPMLGFTTVEFPPDVKSHLLLSNKGNGYWEGDTLCIPDGGRQGVNYNGEWYNVHDFIGERNRHNRRPRAVVMDRHGAQLLYATENTTQDGKPGILIRNLGARLIYHGVRRNP